jgi:hypothetical protein
MQLSSMVAARPPWTVPAVISFCLSALTGPVSPAGELTRHSALSSEDRGLK